MGTSEEILGSYPHLTDEMVRAVYAYATDAVETPRPLAA